MNISKMIMLTMVMVMMTQKLDHFFSELSSSPSGGSPALSQNRAVGSQLRNGGVAFRTQGNDHGNEYYMCLQQDIAKIVFLLAY